MTHHSLFVTYSTAETLHRAQTLALASAARAARAA